MEPEIAILIVEDEDIWIKYLSIVIKDLGFSVVNSVKTVEDALIAFKEENYDIVLLDINIGVTDSGFELGKVVNDTYNKPYIFITAGAYHDIKKISQSNPAAYLQKPINANSLYIAINQALGYHNYSKKDISTTKPESSTFFVKESNIYTKLDWHDISLISAGKNYVSIFNSIDNKEYFIRNSLQKTITTLIPKELQPNFVQINRAQIVQFSHIVEITNNTVHTKYGTLPLTDTYIKDLKNRMNIV